MPRASQDRWMFPMFGILCLLVVGLTIALVLVSTSNTHQGHDIDAFKRVARASCVSRRDYGPALAVAYAKYHILSPGQIAAYKADTPSSCP